MDCDIFKFKDSSVTYTDAVRKMYLTAKPCTDTPVRIGVGVILLDRSGCILLERRSDCGAWGLPGGKVGPGETFTQAAEREILEETGFQAKVMELLGVYSGAEGRVLIFPDNGDVVYIVDVILVAQIRTGTMKLSEESLELRFFNRPALEKIMPDIVPPAIAPLRDYLDGRRYVIA